MPDSGTISVSGRVATVSQLDSKIRLGESTGVDEEPDSDDDEEDALDPDADETVEEWLEARAARGALDFDAVHRLERALSLEPDTPIRTLSHGQRYKRNFHWFRFQFFLFYIFSKTINFNFILSS